MTYGQTSTDASISICEDVIVKTESLVDFIESRIRLESDTDLQEYCDDLLNYLHDGISSLKSLIEEKELEIKYAEE